MYGYGYRYPRVPRKFEVVYEDPNYCYKWARSALMNRGVAQHSPWIQFLRDNHYLEQVSNILRKAGEEYRTIHDVKPKYKIAAERRKTKIEKALTAVQDPEIHNLLRAEFGDKFNNAYIADAVNALKKELDHLNMLIQWQAAPQQPPPQPSTVAKTGRSYGLRHL
jgi:hypothetical protein